MLGILIAGIGNVSKGDEGFGVEVAKRPKASESLPVVHAVHTAIEEIQKTPGPASNPMTFRV